MALGGDVQGLLDNGVMTTFTASKRSTGTVSRPREEVWSLLRDASTVAALTPGVRSIVDQGDTWLWTLAPVEVVGRTVGLSFTEQMTFSPPAKITFARADKPDERAGAEGTYLLQESGSQTVVSIDLTVTVDLPFPRLARPAVQAAMQAVISTMGAGFAHNLERRVSQHHGR